MRRRTVYALSLQGGVSLETERGATYYVQIGGIEFSSLGYPPEYGRLTVSVRP